MKAPATIRAALSLLFAGAIFLLPPLDLHGVPAPKPKNDLDKDMQEIQGTLVVTKVERLGHDCTKSLIGRNSKVAGYFRFDKDEQFFNADSVGRIKLDPSAKPKQFELTATSGAKINGIYKLSDKRLVMCWDSNGKARPTDFKTTKSDPPSLRVWTLERKPIGDENSKK